MGFKENIEKRELNGCSVFMASLLAGLNEFGVLNQGLMNLSSQRAGRYLATFANVKQNTKIDEDKPFEEQLKQIITTLNSILHISDVVVEKEPKNFAVKIKSNRCRFCPKGVGEAELEGTICPFPGVIEEFINHLSSEKVKKVNVDHTTLRKEGDWCIIRYEKVQEK